MILLVFKGECLISDTNPNIPSLSSSFKLLLQEFDNVFPEAMPDGLPPIRGIEH